MTTKPRILVVDDYPGARYRRMRILNDTGQYEVREEFLGREAIRRCAEEDIDLLLIDIHLPDVTGLDVCDALRADAKTARMPILLISAVAEQDQAVELAKKHGAHAFVPDSADAETLVDEVRKALASGRA